MKVVMMLYESMDGTANMIAIVLNTEPILGGYKSDTTCAVARSISA